MRLPVPRLPAGHHPCRIIAALRHRGGLRAEILVSGAIRVGDVIAETDSQNL